MVDAPFAFGQIAAANAISDIYVMGGGTPIMSLAILGMLVDKISLDIIALILESGRQKASEARIPVAGGHSINCLEPVYGLALLVHVNTPAKKKLRYGIRRHISFIKRSWSWNIFFGL